jgi:uncharacterized protein
MNTLITADSLAHVPMLVQHIVAILRTRLKSWYADRLDQIILYGSYARGDFNAESDIDLLVILTDTSLNRLHEIQDLLPIKHDLMIQHGIDISIKAVTQNDYLTRRNAIYFFIRQDGIFL